MTRKIRVPIVSIGDWTELWWAEGETPEAALLAEAQKIVDALQDENYRIDPAGVQGQHTPDLTINILSDELLPPMVVTTLVVPKDDDVHDINRQVIEDDVQQAMQNGTCNVEIPGGAELEYKWRDGVATVEGKDGYIKRYAIVVVRLN